MKQTRYGFDVPGVVDIELGKAGIPVTRMRVTEPDDLVLATIREDMLGATLKVLDLESEPWHKKHTDHDKVVMVQFPNRLVIASRTIRKNPKWQEIKESLQRWTEILQRNILISRSDAASRGSQATWLDIRIGTGYQGYTSRSGTKGKLTLPVARLGWTISDSYSLNLVGELVDGAIYAYNEYNLDLYALNKVLEGYADNKKFFEAVESIGPNKKDSFMAHTAERMINRDTFVATFDDEIKRVLALDGVRGVTFGPKAMMFTTGPIEIAHEGHVHLVSQRGYRVVFYVEPGYIDTRCFNSDGLRNNNHHPHVTVDGAPCMGNVEGAVDTLVRDGELAFAADLVLRFLKTYNPGHEVLDGHIGKWPVKGSGRT